MTRRKRLTPNQHYILRSKMKEVYGENTTPYENHHVMAEKLSSMLEFGVTQSQVRDACTDLNIKTKRQKTYESVGRMKDRIEAMEEEIFSLKKRLAVIENRSLAHPLMSKPTQPAGR